VASSRRLGLPEPISDLSGVAARLDILIDQQDEILAALTGRQASPPSALGTIRVREPEMPSAASSAAPWPVDSGIKGRRRRGR